jgi:type IV secretion system protein TrbG
LSPATILIVALQDPPRPEFPAGIGQGEMPPLWAIGAQGGAELVNYRVQGNHMIVDRLFAAAELRLGGDPQQKVRIVRTDGRPQS